MKLSKVKSQSPYRVGMFVICRKRYESFGKVSIPLSGRYVCNQYCKENGINLLVSIPLSGRYVCNLDKMLSKKKGQAVSIPLSGRYVCNWEIMAWGKFLKSSQSPYRVGMFVITKGISINISNIEESQSPYRVGMFVIANFT